MGTWRKSSYCDIADCVEVKIDNDSIRIRQSGNTTGPLLSFSVQEWRAFVEGVRAGEFDV
jgi:hypothetical protein